MILFSYFLEAIAACHSKQEILQFDNGDSFLIWHGLATLIDTWDNPPTVGWQHFTIFTFHWIKRSLFSSSGDNQPMKHWGYNKASWLQCRLCIILYSPCLSIPCHLHCFHLVYFFTALLSFQNMYAVIIMFYSYTLALQCTMLNYSVQHLDHLDMFNKLMTSQHYIIYAKK